MRSFRDLNRRAVVAIPAKNEAERLAHCLRALGEQLDRRGRPLPRGAFGVVVLANDCDDDTAAVARAAGQGRRYELRVIEARLPRPFAHAGGARRAAMDLAEAWLAERTDRADVILTTDADSLAAPDWLSANLKAFDEGADAVLGRISLDEEGARLPAALHARGKLEAVYEDLLTELCAQLDPQDENPWPHHATISGASLGDPARCLSRRRTVAAGAVRRRQGAGRCVRRRDTPIRFAPDVTVVTSGRIAGRALGGVADTLRLRSADPAAPCDEALERCTTAYRRALWRGRLRRVGLEGEHWREALRVPGAVARRARAATTFGAAWERIEAASPGLVRRPLKPAELPRQIELATRLLTRLQATLSAHEDVEPIFRSPRETDDLDAIL